MTKNQNPGREAPTTNSVINFIESIKHAHAVKIQGTQESRNNPDIFSVIRGVPLIIEMKRPGGGEASPGQVYELIRWKKAGARVIVARSLSYVQSQVKRILQENPLTT